MQMTLPARSWKKVENAPGSHSVRFESCTPRDRPRPRNSAALTGAALILCRAEVLRGAAQRGMLGPEALNFCGRSEVPPLAQEGTSWMWTTGEELLETDRKSVV